MILATEGFLMPLIGSYQENDSSNNRAWALALILRVQMKVIMLIQHDADKKENSLEIWNEVLAMLFWWLIEKLFLPHLTLLVLIEIWLFQKKTNGGRGGVEGILF